MCNHGHDYHGHEIDSCRKEACIDRVRAYLSNTVGNAETLLMFQSICVVAQIKTQKWLWTISTAILE